MACGLSGRPPPASHTWGPMSTTVSLAVLYICGAMVVGGAFEVGTRACQTEAQSLNGHNGPLHTLYLTVRHQRTCHALPTLTVAYVSRPRRWTANGTSSTMCPIARKGSKRAIAPYVRGLNHLERMIGACELVGRWPYVYAASSRLLGFRWKGSRKGFRGLGIGVRCIRGKTRV